MHVQVHQSAFSSALLPVALVTVMLGLGLSLTVADFTRVARYPRAVAVALGCQTLVLPALCFLLVKVTALPAPLAIGLMLLSATPGGTFANLYSHLAGGDVALNVTLTAINSVLSIFTLPIIVNLSLVALLPNGDQLALDPGKVAEVFALVLIPVAAGMALRRWRPGFADRAAKPVKILAVVVLGVVVTFSIVQQLGDIPPALRAVGLPALLFNVASLTIGFLVPQLARVPRRQAIASAMEIGNHNSTLALTIAMSPALLNSTVIAISPAIYQLISFATAAAFGFLVSRRGRVREPVTV